MPALGPYEAGLTPEEREELVQPRMAYEYRPHLLGNPFTQRGMQTRMLAKNPIASLIASTLMGSSKYAAARARGFTAALGVLLKE